MNLVKLKNISAGYEGNIILDNISLDINEGDFIGVIGPNGGGKTTLLKIILGLMKPFSGNIRYTSSNSNLFGYLPQYQGIDKHFPISVKEVVLSGLMSKKKLWQKYNKEDKQKVLDLLSEYKMYEYRNTPIGNISGGQAQKVFLCRAIISSPKILILDEPTTYVDSNFEKELYETLKNLNKEMSIIMVSHDIGTICSHVKTIACVNRKLNYHNSNLITPEELSSYNCPIEILAHGVIPHRVLANHDLMDKNNIL